MKLENEFWVAVPVDRAWEVLTDIPEIAPCLPGARLTGHEGDTYEGMIKIKVGPVTAEYSGTAEFVERDEANKHVTIKAKGRDKRGSGNASADITADMTPEGDGTKVSINTDLKISGKVAQFGKGVITDVSSKLIGQFVDCIEGKLTVPEAAATETAETASAETPSAEPSSAGETVASAATVTNESAAEPTAPAVSKEPILSAASEEPLEALDLMDVAGGAVFKRFIPVLVVAAVVAIVLIAFVL